MALGCRRRASARTLHDHQDTLNRIAGWLIVVLGAFFVCTLFVPRFNQEWRPEALISRAARVARPSPALGSRGRVTPCVGPTLASILAAASTSDTVGKGGLLLALPLGLAIPFLVTAIAFDRATTAFRWLRDRHVLVTAISGAILIAMGLLIVSGQLAVLNAKAQHGLASLGLDFIHNF